MSALLVFDATAPLRSFKPTAEEQPVKQSSISNNIKSIGAHLGPRLFQRDNRRVELTASGAELIIDLKSALDRTEKEMVSVMGMNSRTLNSAA